MKYPEKPDELDAQTIQEILNSFPALELLQQHPIPHALTHNRKLLFVNKSAVKLFDGDNSDHFLGKDITSFIHPLDHGRILNRLEILNDEKTKNNPTEARVYTLNGKIKHIISVSSLIEIAGHTLVLAAATELSEEMGHEISQSEQNFQRLFENMLDVFYRTDSEQNLTLVGPAALGVLGYLPEEVIGLPASSFYFDPQARANIVTAVKKHGKVQNFPARLKHKDGHIVDVEITSSAIYSEDKQFLGMEGLFRDVSEQVVIKEKLHRLATIDELTGILNRRAFLEKANHLIKHLRRQPEYSLLAVIDLDKFKPINDRYGHLSGDRVLKVFVSLFKETLRETDVFGRLGGDEFAIIFRKCTMTEGLEILERIQEKMQKISIRLSDNEVSISASIGLTELHEEDLPFSLALARADRALYQAKQNGGAHVAMLLS